MPAQTEPVLTDPYMDTEAAAESLDDTTAKGADKTLESTDGAKAIPESADDGAEAIPESADDGAEAMPESTEGADQTPETAVEAETTVRAAESPEGGEGLWPLIGVTGAAAVLLGVIFVFMLRKYLFLRRRAQDIRIASDSRHPGVREAQDMAENRQDYAENRQDHAGYGPEFDFIERTLPDMAVHRMQTEEDVKTAPVSEGGQITKELLKPGVYVGKVHHIGRRSSQQDSFGISQNGSFVSYGGKGIFALVADGMGGLKNGGAVSAMVTMAMMQAFDQLPMGYPGEQSLLNMLGEANEQVNAMLGSSGSGKSGSTVVAVIIRNMKLYWITVGDSHIYLYRNGALMQVNRDHVYSIVLDEMAARGEISHQEAAQNPQRKALTSYIGMGKLEKIDRNIRPMQLQSGDRVLLMSDGVFGTLSEEEMSAAMKFSAQESGEAIHQMIQRKNLPAQDNYTALILECV